MNNIINLIQGLPWGPSGCSVTLNTDACMYALGGALEKFYSTRAFLLKLSCRIVLYIGYIVQTDNTTFCKYINKLGGTKSYSQCKLTWDLF